MAFDSTLDESFAITQMMQIENMISTSASRVKRPHNAFNLYFIERKSIERELNPNLSGNDISQLIGKKWSQLSQEEKSPYIERAQMLKLQFKQEHPNYHYQKSKKKKIKSDESTEMFKNQDNNLSQPHNKIFSQDDIVSIDTQIKNMFSSLGHAVIMRFLTQNKSEAQCIFHDLIQMPDAFLS